MKRFSRRVRAVGTAATGALLACAGLLGIGTLLPEPAAAAANPVFVYGVDEGAANSVSAYAVGTDGSLSEVSGSPFSTGGVGALGGAYATVTGALAKYSNRLYVANEGDTPYRTITAFSIDPITGSLTTIGKYSLPFSAVEFNVGVEPSGRYVFAVAPTLIVAIPTKPDGSLDTAAETTSIPTYRASSLDVSADGAFLALTEQNWGAPAPYPSFLEVYSIGTDGSLSALSGSPVAVATTRNLTSVHFGPSSYGAARLFVGGTDQVVCTTCGGDGPVPRVTTTAASMVADYSVTWAGVSAEVSSITDAATDFGPFSHLAVSDDGSTVYATNAGAKTLWSFGVSGAGTLSHLAGPMATTATEGPVGVAVDPGNSWVYTSLMTGPYGSYEVAIDGHSSDLTTELSGSPVDTGRHGFMRSILVYSSVQPPTSPIDLNPALSDFGGSGRAEAVSGGWAVGTTDLPDGVSRGFAYHLGAPNSTLVDLGSLADKPMSDARGVSIDGSGNGWIIGDAYDSQSNYVQVAWTVNGNTISGPTQFSDLGGGGAEDYVSAVVGHWAVGSSFLAGGTVSDGAAWDLSQPAGAPLDLLPLPGDSTAWAQYVSDTDPNGVLAVGLSYPDDGPAHAVAWSVSSGTSTGASLTPAGVPAVQLNGLAAGDIVAVSGISGGLAVGLDWPASSSAEDVFWDLDASVVAKALPTTAADCSSACDVTDVRAPAIGGTWAVGTISYSNGDSRALAWDLSDPTDVTGRDLGDLGGQHWANVTGVGAGWAVGYSMEPGASASLGFAYDLATDGPMFDLGSLGADSYPVASDGTWAVGTSLLYPSGPEHPTGFALPTGGVGNPGPPQGFDTAADNYQVALSWAAPADSGRGTSTITGYDYSYRLDSAASWPPDTTTTDLGATISNLQHDTLYDFRVRSVNSAGLTSAYAFTSATTVRPVDTTLVLNSSGSPSAVGDTVIYSVDVTPASGSASDVNSGTVTFYDGDTVICSETPSGGSASCEQTYADVGSHTIHADFEGNSVWGSSTSETITQDVVSYGTSLTLASSGSPSAAGTTVMYTATVEPIGTTTPPSGGIVDFIDNDQKICHPNVTAGIATCAVTYPTVGSHTVVASFEGNSDYAVSWSDSLEQNVVLYATTVSLASSGSPSALGESVTFTAMASPAAGAPGPVNDGEIVFSEGSSWTCSVTVFDGVASCGHSFDTLGAHTITATFEGTTDYATSTSSELTQTVVDHSTSVSVSTSANPAIIGATVTYTSTVSADDNATITGGTVRVMDSPTHVVCSGGVTAGVATCTSTSSSVGTDPVVAVFGGTGDYASSSSDVVFQYFTYKVQLLYLPSKTVKVGKAVQISFELVNNSNTDLSSSSITATPKCVQKTTSTTCSSISGYSFTLVTPKVAPRKTPQPYYLLTPNLATTGYTTGTYDLHFTVAGDPVEHTAQFTVH